MTDYLKPKDVADQLGISLRTLNRWHALRVGPARCRIYNTVVYREAAIETWVKENETYPTRNFGEVT